MIFQGDAIREMSRMEAGSIDMVLVDPPYGTTGCRWDSIIPFDDMWEQVHRVAKADAALVFFGNQPFTSALGASNISNLKYAWTWRKSRATGHLNAKKMPMKDCEDILVFYRKQPTYNPQGVKDCDIMEHNSKSDSLRGAVTGASSVVSGGIKYAPYRQTRTGYPRQVLDFPSEGKTVHPTQKPTALLEYLIRTYTNEGDTVLDFCMGGGSTGVACAKSGRAFIGVERDPGYFGVASQRIKEAV
jgi:site-specific DNA-methyltransferase (adenine-specific)